MNIPPVDGALMEEVVELASRAGAGTLRWFRSAALTVDWKPDATPVTQADRAAEHLIRTYLADHHPNDAILGEEEGARPGTSGRRWFIDPIDGTRSFVHGVPEYATLLAVEDTFGMAIGVIHLPAMGETIAAGRGLGCFLNGERCQVSERMDVSAAVLTRSEYRQTPPEMLTRLDESPVQNVTWGDAYGYALVATGRIDAMLDSMATPGIWRR